MTWLCVFVGGGLGAISRFALSSLLPSTIESGKLPLGVLACNIIGCFLIGIVFALQKENTPTWLPPLIITGFLGGFTTFSSFGLETFKLYEAGYLLTALLYITTSLIGSIVALIIAIKIIR